MSRMPLEQHRASASSDDSSAGHPLYVYYHTHWDREWYLPFREYQFRLIKVIDALLDVLEQGKLPCFTLDGQTVVLEDYLEFRPENAGRLQALVEQGKMSVGPWYVMPDEFLVSGESLIRNLQRGLQISRQFGQKTFTGYLPDTFGHSADIPMVLAQLGMETAVVWRGVKPGPPWFFWDSPSGDRLLTYHLTEGYFQNVFHMGKNQTEKREFFQNWLEKIENLTPEGMPILFPVGADHLGVELESPHLLHQWAPQAQTITVDNFMGRAHGLVQENLPVLSGELRDPNGPYLLPGVFASRMYLKQWNRVLEWRLTRQLEQLLCWQRLLGYPVRYGHELDFLWKTLLLNHPHDSICGCSVDSVHRENEVRFAQIDELSASIVRDLHDELCLNLQPADQALILNLSDRPYTGVVEIEQDYPLSNSRPDKISNGQVLSEQEGLDETFLHDYNILPLSENKSIRRKSLIWVSDVPAHGYTNVESGIVPPDMVVVDKDNVLENDWVRVTVEPTGSLMIDDKKNRRTYNGMHQLWRNEEQGDSYNAAPVPGKPSEKAKWVTTSVVHRGPLRGVLRLTTCFAGIEMMMTTDIALTAGSPRVDFETRFVNTTPDHKIQVRFDAAKPIDTVWAEGHFNVIERKYDPSYRIAQQMPAPRLKELPVANGAIERFIGFDGQTLITEGLAEYEVEGSAMMLTLHRGFSMLSSDKTEVRGSHAGPPLPTPEGQCLNRSFDCRYAWLPGWNPERAFVESDWFYGGIYGFDRKPGSDEKQESGEPICGTPAIMAQGRSFFGWENPAIQSTATLADAKGVALRLLNPTATGQQATLVLQRDVKSVQKRNLDGQVLATQADSSVTVPPLSIQTWHLEVD